MSYIDIFRRRWVLVAAALGVALIVTWVTLPATPEQEVPRASSYQATATLVANPSTTGTMNLSTAALYATVGEVPKRAARRLGYTGEPQVLAAGVNVSADPETGTLAVSTTDSDGAVAARTANVFAEELIAYFERSANDEAKKQRAVIDDTLAGYAERIARLDAEIARRPADTVLVAERDGLRTQYQALVTQAASMAEQVTGTTPITMLQRAVAIPQGAGSFAPPSATGDRLLVAAGLGLVLGLALALVVERLDSRLRTPDQVEEALGLPVLAEIPAADRRPRGEHKILSATEPGSSTAEAFRALRSSLLLLGPTGRDVRSDGGSPRGTVVLVTSARPGEGKTTTVANLAVVMAETGRTVLVLSLDFRNPSVHEYFDVPAGSGLSDLLFSGREAELEHIVRATAFPGVSIATSGQELGHPGALLAGSKRLIDRARELADVVLIDSPPVLAVSDALDLSAHVDAVLVVSRAKRTTAAHAESAKRLLSRLGVPALGAVLVGSPGSGSFYGYSYGSAHRQQRASGASSTATASSARSTTIHASHRGEKAP